MNAIIDDFNENADAPGIKSIGTIDRILAFDRTSLIMQMQLAACLIKTGVAKGMAINLEGQDSHFGGSSVFTARSAAFTFATVVALWRWVKQNGLQDDVMVVMADEFSRTPYNTHAGRSFDISVGGKTVSVACPGTDHHPVAGMIVINGKMGESQGLRIGAIIDDYHVTGTNEAAGGGSPSITAFKSIEVVGSLLMRCFPEAFPNTKAVTDI